jgi:hypothetical protein
LPPSEFAKAQLQQSIETYRVQLSLLVQICTVFVVADAATVGYGLQQRLAGALWVGLVFPVAMLMVMKGIVRLTIPILATAVSIEAKYRDSDGGLMSTFVAVAISHHFLEQIRSAALLTTEPARAKALANLNRPYVFLGANTTKLLLYLIIIGQTGAPLLLLRFAGWNFAGQIVR